MSTGTRRTVRGIELSRKHYSFFAVYLVLTGGVFGVAVASPTEELPVGVTAVQGSSMEPTISGPGLVVYIETGDLEKGDIIVYQASYNHPDYREGVSTWYVHRIVGKTSRGYVTQGDNVSHPDQWWNRRYARHSNTAGEVVLSFSPGGGIDVWWPW